MDREEWLLRRTYRGADYDPGRLAHAACERGLSVSVVLPCLNVAGSVGPIVTALREGLMRDVPLLGEIVVVDSRSTDATARVAAEAGARVVQDREVLPGLAPGHGKGEAMWKGLATTTGEIVVYLDADVMEFDPAFVTGLVGPLLADPEVGYVKAVYRRHLGGEADGGGRVTEICARPLIDLARTAGLGALAQVDLGERRHHNQPTAALGAMASTISQALLRRLAEEGRAPEGIDGDGLYARPGRGAEGVMTLTVLDTRPHERPPLIDVLQASAT